MGDMGLAGAYGAQGAADALRQLIKDRLEREQQQFTNNRLTMNDKMNADLHAEQMRSLQENRASAQQAALEGEAAKGVAGLSIDQSIPAPMVGRLRGTMQAANIRENPPLAQPPNLPGMMQPDIVPGMQPGAVWTGTDAQRKTRADDQQMADVMNDEHTTPQVKSFLRMRAVMPKGENIPYQLITEPNGPPKAPRQPVQVGPQGIFTDPADAIGKPAYHAPQQTATVTIQTTDDQGNPVTRVVQKKDAIGKDFAHPSAQDVQHTRTNKEAQDTLTQLDQAIDNAKDLIGPGAGRISNLEQMAGSADPRIQALGVKMKAAKMRVDHAVTGSVRSGASPTLLAQWDNILANKVTPEGLKAGVQAMREIIGGGAPAAVSGGGTVEHWELGPDGTPRPRR